MVLAGAEVLLLYGFSALTVVHHVLRWLHTKLAEWIGENLQDVLGFPDKADQRAEPGTGWTPAALNHILTAHVVDGLLTKFGCMEWESQLFRVVMSARWYPFNLPKSASIPSESTHRLAAL
jgi:hypothetical protein